MRTFRALLMVGALALGGCGTIEKQAFNRGANSAIRTITILEPAPSTGFGVQVMNHPALGFGLIGAAIYSAEMASKSKSLDEVMKPLGWRLSDELASAVAEELKRGGYEVKRVAVDRDGFGPIKDYAPLVADTSRAEALASDAWLDLATRDPLYVANSPAADYVPSIGVTVRLVSSKGQALLYREDLFFGYAFNAPRLEAVVIPAGAEYRFPAHGDLLADPKRTLKGLAEGVPLIAKRVASDLAREGAGAPQQARPPISPTAATK